ncbi:UDP-glucose epimerase [Pseudozyma hubeiensis SY62]|uniref:UDP-glucose epimerase n=1 Tax=Pseudozyma hubeiensis (strain SY62) TaxID=1305764 RepID=R9P186_PSEHS|nr:UDP-glucose epimerase [Pseudozyma hubeiensis SY62]GAC94847.1 UDP-glucose epimerase [Pseudozyma hubeiensis SY62]
MSQTELAADRLRQCLDGLIPSLIESLSHLRRASQALALLPFTQVHDALKPLIDTQATREAFGLTADLATADKAGPEVRIRNLCLEISNNQLRKIVLEHPSGLIADRQLDIDQTTLQSRLASTFDRLDAVLVLSLHDLIDPTLPLSLVEELIESQPISTCSRLFGYTESRVQPLTIDLHPTRGKGLVLLRTCNELLRRLSKPSQQHTVFAGRILSLLAKVFPLGERSGVNLRGEFNVENKTIIEDRTDNDSGQADDDIDSDDKDQVFKVDYEFYELFWKVQRFFSNPPTLMGAQDPSRPSTRSTTPAEAGETDRAISDDDPAPDGAKGPMAELRISTAKILKLFGAVNKREKELAGAASAEEAKNNRSKGGALRAGSESATPLSNKRPNDSLAANTGYVVGLSLGRKADEPPTKRSRPDIEDGVVGPNADIDQDMLDPIAEAAEREAVAERGHFFPTYLTGRKLFEYEIRDTSFRKHILVQYLVLFQYLLSFTPAAKESWKDWKNKTLQALFTLEEADERWIRSTWREIQALIREIQPDGRLFLESVLEVLKREANWIRWKTESCPSIEKPPLSPEQMAQFASARALLLRKAEPYPHKLGTAALSELWEDGLKPPVPGTRRVENEMGEYVTVATDGLEELEFAPAAPSLEHYNKSIQREKMKLDMRKKQLGIDPATAETELTKEERDKLEKDERVQATIETMQSLAWRALRVASRDNLHLFGKPDRPENIEGLLKEMEDERNPKPKAAMPVQQAVADSVTKTEDTDAGKAEEGAEDGTSKAVKAEDLEMTDVTSQGPAKLSPEQPKIKDEGELATGSSDIPVAIPAVPTTTEVSETGIEARAEPNDIKASAEPDAKVETETTTEGVKPDPASARDTTTVREEDVDMSEAA